jgi:hypothetical protein
MHPSWVPSLDKRAGFGGKAQVRNGLGGFEQAVFMLQKFET